MISVARKNLLAEKTRFLASISGVAFSILLIIVLLGVNHAFANLATAYLDNVDADIVIAQEGTTDMFHTFSVLGKEKINQVERITKGKAYGLISKPTNILTSEEDGSKIIDYPGRPKNKNITGNKETISIIGYDTKSGIGGPWITLAGNSIPKEKEIIVDRVFAKKTNLTLGDQIEAYNKIFTISGITDQNNVLVYSRAFIDINEAQDILKEKDTINFILVQLADPSQANQMVNKLENEINNISAFTIEDFATSNAKMITDSFLPIIYVITIIGFLTGAVVVGLTVYTATMEKISEFGVLKAIGANNFRLFMIVFEQAIWSSILGFIIGVIGAWGVTKLVTDLVPVMLVETTPGIYLFAFSTSILISLVASYLPVQKIAKIDPAIVFRK